MAAVPPPLARLARNLVDRQVHVRKTAIRQLQSLYGMGAFDLFRQALQDQQASVRLEAVRALRELQDPQAIPVLLPLLTDRSKQVRCAIPHTLV